MSFLDLLNYLPHSLSTVIIAMTPILELRASIPIALGIYKMSFLGAVSFSIIGDMIPAILILKFIGPISDFARKKSRLVDRAFDWWFKRTEKNFVQGFAKYGLIALFIFVAVPFPGTGSWSGALAAFLFRLPFVSSLAAIFGGVVVAALAVAGASLGLIALF